MARPSSVVTLFENGDAIKSSYAVKAGIAQMLRGGVIVEVSCPQQAKIAEEAGALAVSVVSVDDRESVFRMVDPDLIRSIKKATILPVIAKARVGHFVEAQVLEHLGVDFIDESESLTCADDANFINKHNFSVPFISGCSNLGETLRRMAEGASLIRTQGRYHYHDDVDTDTCCCDAYNGGKNGNTMKGNIMHSVQQIRSIFGDARRIQSFEREELHCFAKQIRAPYELLKLTKQLGRLPIMVFGYGGICTPADAAMAMQLGCDGVFLESDVLQGPEALRKVRAFVQAVSSYNDSQLLADLMSMDRNMDQNVKRRLPIINRKDSSRQREDDNDAACVYDRTEIVIDSNYDVVERYEIGESSNSQEGSNEIGEVSNGQQGSYEIGQPSIAQQDKLDQSSSVQQNKLDGTVTSEPNKVHQPSIDLQNNNEKEDNENEEEYNTDPAQAGVNVEQKGNDSNDLTHLKQKTHNEDGNVSDKMETVTQIIK